MEIRQANHEDSAGIAKVQVDSFLTAYAKIFPSIYLQHFTYEEQEQEWCDWFSSNQQPLYVAVTGQGEVIGYALGQSHSIEMLPYESELVALHVQREYHLQGLGSRLFASVCKELSALGSQSFFLWVLAESPARHFYKKFGGKLVGEKAWQNNACFGTNIQEVAYGWLDIKKIVNNNQE